MRVALVTRDYTARGGVEKISQYYARILHERGHEVHVWCSDLSTSPEDSGIHFHQIKTYCGKGWLYILIFALLVGARLRPSDYDAVVVMGVAGLCRSSFVVANSVHRHWYEYSLSKTKTLSGRWWLKVLNIQHYIVIALEQWQYRQGFYRRVIAVSEPIKHELNRCYGVPLEQIDILPNGADLEALTLNSAVRQSVRTELGIAPDELLLCMLVNEIERKGVRQVMAAVQQLRSYPLRLLVVGRLNQTECILAAKQMGVSDLVIVRPSTSDVRSYLWASDAYVLPTQYEAWNLSIMEAHAAGLPVITTRLNQADLVVAHGESGFLLNDPLDLSELVAAIKAWVERPDKAAMSATARKRAQPYTWYNLTVQLESLIAPAKKAAVKLPK